MAKKLENILKGLVTAGLIAFSVIGCSKENPVEPRASAPASKQNSPPAFVSYPPTSVDEGQVYNYLPKASDADGDNLTYSLVKSPSWLSISSYNVVSGTAPQVSADEVHDIEVRVSDREKAVSQKYNLTVKNLTDTHLTGTYVLSDGELNGLIVNDNSLSFSQPTNFAANDIISAGISNSTPCGLLREVKSVSSDKKTVYTEQATLEQAVQDASFSYSGKLLPSSIISSSLMKGAKTSAISGSDFEISLKNVVLFDYDGDSNSKDDQLVANGKITFDSDLIFNCSISGHQLNSLVFKNTSELKSDITLGFNLMGFAQSYQVKLAEYKLQPFTAGYLPTLPIPLPVIIVPEIDVYIKIDPAKLNPLSANVKHDAKLEIGVTYNGVWNPYSTFSNTFDFSNPVVKREMELKVSAGPSLELMLYGFAGPFVSASGKMRLKAENSSWGLYGGLEASAGIKMEIIKKNISAKLFPMIIDYEKLLAEGGASDLEGKIAYVSSKNNDAHIYSMNSDGSMQTNLSDNFSGWDTDPSWSPDGTKILCSSKGSSAQDYDIYVMNSNGTNRTLIANSSMNESSPAFSPSGDKIAYSAGDLVGYSQIYVMNPDGSSSVKITNDNDYYCWDISWAPGQKILYASNKDHSNGEIYAINPDGSNIKRLTNNSAYDRFPSWSPDGKQIAFASNRDGNDEIYVMNSDGSSQTNISNSPNTTDEHPSWSPDGTKIVYVSRTGTSSQSNEIWIMDSDGLNKKRITNNSYLDGSPSWSQK